MNFKKSIFDERPELVCQEGGQVRINFGVEPRSVNVGGESNEQERMAFFAYVVRVSHPVTRSKVIDAIVTAGYPNDEMQAIINNHLLENDSPEHEAEFEEMQAWRATAKTVAAEVMELLEE